MNQLEPLYIVEKRSEMMKQSSPAVNLQRPGRFGCFGNMGLPWLWPRTALLHLNPPLNEQSLVYDLTMNGQIVGQRRIRIQYLPASSNYCMEAELSKSLGPVSTTMFL